MNASIHVNRPLSRGGHFVSGDLKSFVYARLASFSPRDKGLWGVYLKLLRDWSKSIGGGGGGPGQGGGGSWGFEP